MFLLNVLGSSVPLSQFLSIAFTLLPSKKTRCTWIWIKRIKNRKFVFFFFFVYKERKNTSMKNRELTHKIKEKMCFKSIFMYALSEVKTTRKKIVIPLSENRGNESLRIRQYRKVLSYKYDWEILPGKENTGMKKTILSASAFFFCSI